MQLLVEKNAFAAQFTPIVGTNEFLTDGTHTMSGATGSLVGIFGAAIDGAVVLAGAIGPVIGA